ncbi:MAG: helix-turn-helix transcriptional regulator [Clostridia bacterium]|nr:helix-turn-helix transcriptional regulator [Clostridia bacterium]
MEDVRKNIAKNILYYRKKFKFSQKELAEKLGVKNASVSNWERETNSPDIDSVFQMCKIFNISIDEFFGASASNHAESKALDNKELSLVYIYRDLNTEGRERLLEYADDLVQSGKYKNNNISQMVEKNA